MFGLNSIVGKKFFKDAPQEQLLVTSRFYTIQGEGPFRGMPSYFIRLAKCNLACSFCDTYFDSGTWKTFDELINESDAVINEFFAKRNIKTPFWAKSYMAPTKLSFQGQEFYGRVERVPSNVVLVITGGEPSIQDNLSKFLHIASRYFARTQIESNGINVLDGMPDNTTLVVSPKCLEKDGNAVKYLEPNLEMLKRADCLKFVMCAPNDKFSPYSEIPEWAHNWAEETKKPIYVSPMNIYLKEPQKAKELRAAKQLTEISIEERSNIDEVISFWEPGLLDMPANQRNHEYTAEYALKYGYIFQVQLHLFASVA